MTSIPVQMGLFGGANELVGMHVVAAHTRVTTDGDAVFVAEHLRWNRGRHAGPPAPRPKPPMPGPAQASLFGPPASAPLGPLTTP
jgi:hypothetical protein